MPEKTTSGIPGLDPLIDGGFPAGRAVLVCGGAGTGKTTFGLQFLIDGLTQEQPGIFVSIDEKPRHLVADAHALGWDLNGPLSRGELLILDASPYFTATRSGTWTGLGIDARHIAGDLVQQVRKAGARRLVIDSLTSLVPPDLPRGHAHDYLRSLIQSWEDNLGCTVVMTCRGSRLDPNGSCSAARSLASGVIELRLTANTKRRSRALRVRKMRGTAIDLTERAMTLDRHAGLALVDHREVSSLFTRGPRPVADEVRPPSNRQAAV